MLAPPRSSIPCAVAVVEPKTWRPLLHLVGLASIIVTFLAASAAPTPLYATYQQAWGFSALTTTVVFGIYAVALFATLLTLGRLSDHIGRRPAILIGIAGQLVAMAVFVDAHSVSRAPGGTDHPGGGDRNRARRHRCRRCSTSTRPAVPWPTQPHRVWERRASVLSAFAVQWLPAPTRLVYVVLAGLMMAQAFVVIWLPETSPRASGAWHSLVPQIGVPAQTRRPMLAAAPVLFAGWALGAFMASLGPSLIDHLVGSASVIDGGLGLGLLAGVAAVATYVLRPTPAPA